jgi:signal recognition particle subunit SRP19
MGEILPYYSPGLTGGGVSENFLKDMMAEMGGAGGMPGGAGGPGGMAGMLQGMMGGGGGGGESSSSQQPKIKDKKKGKP